MSKQTRLSHPIYSFLPTEVEGFDSLAELALDIRWPWNHATDKVWRQFDPKLWETCGTSGLRGFPVNSMPTGLDGPYPQWKSL
jgi:hypothetical protein